MQLLKTCDTTLQRYLRDAGWPCGSNFIGELIETLSVPLEAEACIPVFTGYASGRYDKYRRLKMYMHYLFNTDRLANTATSYIHIYLQAFKHKCPNMVLYNIHTIYVQKR